MPRSICHIQATGDRDTISLIQNDHDEYVLTMGRNGISRATVVMPVNLLAMGKAIAAEFPDEPVQPDVAKIPAALKELIVLLPAIGEMLDSTERTSVKNAFSALIDLLYPSPIELSPPPRPFGGGTVTYNPKEPF